MGHVAIAQPAVLLGDKPVLQTKRETTSQVSPLLSLIAGGIAGGVEASITYPTEFLKTRQQLKSANTSSGIIQSFKEILRNEGLSTLYTGCSTLVVGTACKAGVRFLTFDAIKSSLVDSNGKLSTSRGILAGMTAGCVESFVAVTPTERLKTALIDDSKHAKRFKSSAHAAVLILREQGPRGFYKGLLSTTLKQSATSGVRMGSYNQLKELSKNYDLPQNFATTFITGAIAGVITVYATQPFDTIKTRSQSARGARTAHAAKSIFLDYGLAGFWKGSTMRLSRLVFSGGIVFSVYEQIVSAFRPVGNNTTVV